MSREVKVNYGKCTSTIDQISQLEWSEDAPSIFINLKRFEGKPGLLNCYNSENLRMWLNNKDNYFAEWRKRPDAATLQDNGAGGAPNLQGPRYVRLYTPNETVYLVVDDKVRQLRSGKQDFVMYDTKYLGRVRLGNLRGLLTVVGALHGQVPGEDVYLLTTAIPTLGHADYEVSEVAQKANDDISVEDAARNVPIETNLNLPLSEDEDSSMSESAEDDFLDAIAYRDPEKLAEAMANLSEAELDEIKVLGLFETINHGWAEGLSLLIATIDYNLDAYFDLRRATPLSYAIRRKKLEEAIILLKSGATVYARDFIALDEAITISYYSGVSTLLKYVPGHVPLPLFEKAVNIAYSNPNSRKAQRVMRAVSKKSYIAGTDRTTYARFTQLSSGSRT